MEHKDIKEILNDPSKIQEFANLNDFANLAAKDILQLLLEKPEVSDEVNQYIWSSDSSDDLKGYVSGEEKGYKRGHEAGFVKGAFLGILAAGSIFVTCFFNKK